MTPAPDPVLANLTTPGGLLGFEEPDSIRNADAVLATQRALNKFEAVASKTDLADVADTHRDISLAAFDHVTAQADNNDMLTAHIKDAALADFDNAANKADAAPPPQPMSTPNLTQAPAPSTQGLTQPPVMPQAPPLSPPLA